MLDVECKPSFVFWFPSMFLLFSLQTAMLLLLLLLLTARQARAVKTRPCNYLSDKTLTREDRFIYVGYPWTRSQVFFEGRSQLQILYSFRFLFSFFSVKGFDASKVAEDLKIAMGVTNPGDENLPTSERKYYEISFDIQSINLVR